MFRHRKRLISKRLTRLMHQKTQKSMKALFSTFMQSRAQQVNDLAPLQQQPQKTQQPIEEESESIESEEIEIQQEEEDDGPAQFSIANYVATLSSYEKKMFKQQNPQLPETTFMTKKEKTIYFSIKGQKYQNTLKKTPDRKSKTAKHVHFKEKFAFKPFNQHEKVAEVKKAKELQSPYSSKIHFS